MLIQIIPASNVPIVPVDARIIWYLIQLSDSVLALTPTQQLSKAYVIVVTTKIALE